MARAKRNRTGLEMTVFQIRRDSAIIIRIVQEWPYYYQGCQVVRRFLTKLRGNVQSFFGNPPSAHLILPRVSSLFARVESKLPVPW